MSVENFIPKVWSANLLENLHKSLVAANVSNREYEGEIANFGDTVKINSIGAITTNTYTKYTDITFEELEDAQRVLSIDQQKYFAFEIDDVDEAQTKPKLMAGAMRESAYSLKNTADAYMLGLYAENGYAVGTNTTPIDITSLNVEEYILQCGETLSDGDVPEDGRYMIIPPWFMTKIVLAGIANLTDNVDEWTNGYVGQALGFKFYQSTNVSKNSTSWDKTRIMCGREGVTMAYAEQIIKMEALRREKRFSDAMKGLHVYGGKIIRPDQGLTFYADKTSE